MGTGGGLLGWPPLASSCRYASSWARFRNAHSAASASCFSACSMLARSSFCTRGRRLQNRRRHRHRHRHRRVCARMAAGCRAGTHARTCAFPTYKSSCGADDRGRATCTAGGGPFAAEHGCGVQVLLLPARGCVRVCACASCAPKAKARSLCAQHGHAPVCWRAGMRTGVAALLEHRVRQFRTARTYTSAHKHRHMHTHAQKQAHTEKAPGWSAMGTTERRSPLAYGRDAGHSAHAHGSPERSAPHRGKARKDLMSLFPCCAPQARAHTCAHITRIHAHTWARTWLAPSSCSCPPDMGCCTGMQGGARTCLVEAPCLGVRKGACS